MYQYLNKYFSINKNVALPGIGSFYAETQPANLDFINKTLFPPAAVIHYRNDEAVADEKFYSFLSKEAGIDQPELENRFNKFIKDLKQRLESGTVLEFSGIGTLQKNEEGFIFKQDESLQNIFPSIPAERVVRQHAEHNVRVGEDDKTSTEMHVQLAWQEVKEEQWWIAAVVLAVAGIAAILVYYFK